MRLSLDVQFLPAAPAKDVAVVIDVLRMTTTASQLFTLGLKELYVVPGVEDAREIARVRELLLLGERLGKALPGFDGGNSPLEYSGERIAHKGAVLCTSNGSKAVAFAAEAKALLLGAIVNAPAVARRALDLASSDIALICAGTEGQVSLDDVLGAACIARELLALAPELSLSDSSKLALKALEATPDLLEGLKEAKHGRLLQEIGFSSDLEFAATPGRLEAVGERNGLEPPLFVRAQSYK